MKSSIARGLLVIFGVALVCYSLAVSGVTYTWPNRNLTTVIWCAGILLSITLQIFVASLTLWIYSEVTFSAISRTIPFAEALLYSVGGSIVAYSPLPGAVIGRSLFWKKYGISGRSIAAANGVYILSALIATVVLSLIVILLEVVGGSFSQSTLFPVVVGAAWGFTVYIYLTFSRFTLSQTKRRTSLSWLWMIFSHVVIQGSVLVNFYLLAKCWGESIDLVTLVAINPLQFLISAIGIVPAGLGIREFLLTLVEQHSHGSSQVALYSLIERALSLSLLAVVFLMVSRSLGSGFSAKLGDFVGQQKSSKGEAQ